MALRCTQKLLAKLGVDRPGEPPPATALLGDWVATLLVMRPAHLVVCVNERSFLAVVVAARRLDTLAERFERMLGEVLAAIGASRAAVEAELERLHPIAFARTKDRHAVGVLNDACGSIKFLAPLKPDHTVYDWSLELTNPPRGPLRHEFPVDAALRLLCEPPRPRHFPAAVPEETAAVLPYPAPAPAPPPAGRREHGLLQEKRVRRALRELAGVVHEEELRQALEPVADALHRMRRGEISPIEVSEIIHEFHQGPARWIWASHLSLDPVSLVARGVAGGVLPRERVPAEILAALEPKILAYRDDDPDDG